MPITQPNPIIRHVRRLAASAEQAQRGPPRAKAAERPVGRAYACGANADEPREETWSDRHLLERFAHRHDEAAFTALVQRHGPLVLRVCLRVLNDHHAAEDAFQTTFLVLAQKAGSLRQPEALAAFLYGVALRTARKARTRIARQRRSERQAAAAAAAHRVVDADEPGWSDWHAAVDEAILRLPEKYRIPFILHCLEGVTLAEVAQRLGCPRGTVATHLARAREQLRASMRRRGLTLSPASIALLLGERVAPAFVPGQLLATTRAALAAARQKVEISAVAALLQGGKAMLVTKAKSVVFLLLALGMAGGATGLHGQRLGGGLDVPAVSAAAPVPVVAAAPPAGPMQAEKDFRIAEFYRRTGRGGAAGFYYALVCRRYPGTAFARKAAERLSEVKDILVSVQEASTGSLMFGVGVNSDSGLTGSIVLNERNFDITRPPISLSINYDTDFRGAGQEFRIEAIPGTQLQRYTVSFVHSGTVNAPGLLRMMALLNGKVILEEVVREQDSAGYVRHFEQTRDFLSNFFDVTYANRYAGRIELQEKMTHLAEGSASRVAATVNGAAILAEEVSAAAFPSPAGARAKKTLHETLERLVEREVILQDAFARLQQHPEALQKLRAAARKEFDRQWPRCLAETGLKTNEQLQAALRSQGTSLSAVQRQWERNFLAREYMRNRVGRLPAQQEEKRIIAELKRRAMIEYGPLSIH
jgi:RNA polymerase sigma factor (sigma-70 family)